MKHYLFLFVVLLFCIVHAQKVDENDQLREFARMLEDFVKEPADLRFKPRDDSAPVNHTTVSTSLGSIVGVEENGYRSFKGIPFAKPPIGNNRWSSPIPVEPWTDELQALEFVSACPQMQKAANSTPFITAPMSEDCLYLNIWAPINLPDGPVPVMVWFHGGSFWTGWGGDGLFWGDFMVNITSNTIIVTTNYRLGALGFFNTPNLSGNYGFQDQQMALQWVQDHISSFGGDPSRVTIFGQSAGAMSVTLHSLVPSSAGLFSRAIAESNPAGINYRTPEQNYPYTEKVSGLLNCSYTDTECLRSKTWEEIVDAQAKGYMVEFPLTTLEFLPYAPIIDGTLIPEQPMELFRTNGVNSNVEAIVFGANRNESMAMFKRDLPINAFVYKTMVEAFFTSNSSLVLDEYPASRTESNMNQFSVMSSDWVFLCASRFAASAFANSGTPTYFYNFLHVPSNDPINYVRIPCHSAVCHSAEISFVHNSVDFVPTGSYTPDERKLAWSFINYWLDFAHGSVEANAFGPEWPQFNSTYVSLSLNLPEITTLTEYKANEVSIFISSLNNY